MYVDDTRRFKKANISCSFSLTHSCKCLAHSKVLTRTLQMTILPQEVLSAILDWTGAPGSSRVYLPALSCQPGQEAGSGQHKPGI